ncbi:placenta-specific gene 8 protein-like [Cololabis saira]|uniref:placenta-specific gene 8 protein-like n=1 Tax=Cololabis saira TaxID=129043 RepID=UPI002AD52578|nr:placenta-specific gene 8 protein-like [Cololabis saira]
MEEKRSEEWSTHLFDCFEDASTCCYGFWCGPCLTCTVSGRLREPYCLPLCDVLSTVWLMTSKIPCIVPPAALSLRMALRHKYGIKGTIMNDMMAACCCTCCSWCQMHRELKRRMKTPTVINMETQNIVNIQPAPALMAAGSLSPPDYMDQPKAIMCSPSNPAPSAPGYETKHCDF